MFNDCVTFETGLKNSKNMFVDEFCALNQPASFNALNFTAQENGCLSLLDTVITHDPNNISQNNLTGIKLDLSLFDMHEAG